MNKAQRTVLIVAVLVILGMCAFPPCHGYGGRPDYASLWSILWFNSGPVLISLLLTQIVIVLVITTLLVMAFKPATKALPPDA